MPPRKTPPASSPSSLPLAGTYATDVSAAEFRLVVVLGCIVAGIGHRTDGFLPSWAPVAFDIVLMVFLAIQRRRFAMKGRDSAALESIAEEVYLLGYLFTLVSLLGLVLPFLAGGAGVRTGTERLIGLVGIKLATTGVGLLAMVVLRHEARQWSAAGLHSPSPEERFEEALAKLNGQTKAFADNLGRAFANLDPTHVLNITESTQLVIEAMNRTAREVEGLRSAVGPEGLNGRLGELGVVASRLSQQLSVIPGEAERAAVALSSLAGAGTSFSQLGRQIQDGFEPVVQRSAASVVDFGEKASEGAEAMGDAVKRIQAFARALGRARAVTATAEVSEAAAGRDLAEPAPGVVSRGSSNLRRSGDGKTAVPGAYNTRSTVSPPGADTGDRESAEEPWTGMPPATPMSPVGSPLGPQQGSGRVVSPSEPEPPGSEASRGPEPILQPISLLPPPVPQAPSEAGRPGSPSAVRPPENTVPRPVVEQPVGDDGDPGNPVTEPVAQRTFLGRIGAVLGLR